ncbi:MAG: hypothetical protein OEL19_00935 [Sulfurimonas sp.]|nr:hypothetical protein [Sulfurimonas sp.]
MRLFTHLDFCYFLCIESANAFDDTRVLEPQEVRTLEATVF